MLLNCYCEISDDVFPYFPSMSSSNEDSSLSEPTLRVKSYKNISTRNASEELEKYIRNFTNDVQEQTKQTPGTFGCYGSPNELLLSTKPRVSSSPKVEGIFVEKHRAMENDLVRWVNDSYVKDLKRKIVPFGESSISSLEDAKTVTDHEYLEGDDKHQHDDSSSLNDKDMELSTLPSPNSVSDFESIAGSINTDMLVKGFYKNTKQEIPHPGWINEILEAKDYPSWIDDIHESKYGSKISPPRMHPRRKERFSRSLSPSIFEQQLFSSDQSFPQVALSHKTRDDAKVDVHF
ncbi:uncharacterized protein LOC124451176 [Xenia sp. Carnegie-2017]|uniref:uncharacterized protein LOC124451176 n=1 Tax=Xenia sp. Carnegie-2017 TaxID=2897299 RepID=UPI001F03A45D|nr:uncharacterized protein LOC124451176 [Xenia sp. Carnegie-2017]